MISARSIMMLLLLTGVIYAHPLLAQEENIWAFGSRAGLDFSNGSPLPIQTSISGFGEANASVCDQNGQLLFYTEGSSIWDRYGNLMPDGTDLTPFAPGQSATSSSCQGALIVPYPEQEHKYYVFSLTNVEMGVNMGRLYYCIVDMELNGGLGGIVSGTKGTFLDSMLTESMVASVGDRCNTWLITRSTFYQKFKTYEISASGLNSTPAVATAGGAGTSGTMIVSSDRKKLAVATTGMYGLWLYDFDPVSGIPFNPIMLRPYAMCLGVAFSPDNSKLYVAQNGGILVQYDISSNDSTLINSSETIIDTIACVYTHLKLAPNGKIYFQSSAFASSPARVGVINYPDLSGVACGLTNDVITLLAGTGMNAGLPNVVPIIPHDTFYTQQEISAGCFATQTMIQALDDSTGWDYMWNTGSLETTALVESPDTYWVSYRTPPCNFHTDTFRVGFPNGVLPTIHIDTACVDNANGGAYAATYPGDTVHYAYTWLSGTDTLSLTDSLGPVPSGNYTVLIHTVHCDTSLNFIIPEVNYRVSFTVADTLLCMGDVFQFQNTSDSHFDHFIWYFGDGDSSLVTTPPGHPYVHAGHYDIVLTGSGAICKDTARQPVVVDSFFSTAFEVDQSELCVGDDVLFQLAAADTTFTGLHWDWGDDSYMTTAYASRFYHAFDRPGTWPVQVTLSARACPDTFFTDTIKVYALPEVNLGTDTSLCLDGHAVVLHNLAAAPDEPHHYLWSTGDTTVGLRVLQPGTYSLRITTAPLGCTTTDEIEVTKDCYTNIPNAFTPNGDGDNDYFFPRTQLSQSVSDLKMQVFNRWGQMVFETRTIDGRGWDGRFNEKEQPLGVYLYLIDVIYTNGRQERYEGNVTLVR